MSAFVHGLKHGFMHGMFDRMFCCPNMFFACNQTPLFFTPMMNFGAFTRYMTPLPNIQMPLFNFAPNFQTPTFSSFPQEPDFEFRERINSDFKNAVDNVKFEAPDFSNIDTFTRTTTNDFSSGSPAPSVNPFSSPAQFSAPAVSQGITFSPAQTQSSSSSSTPPKTGKVTKHWTEMSDNELLATYGNYTRDITKLYSGSASALNKYLQGKGKLEGTGQAFLDAQQKYGISASVLIGICMNESVQGTSPLAKNNNNFAGIRKRGSKEFRKFNSPNECIDFVASLLKNHYVTNSGVSGRNLTRLYQINGKYCPASETANNASWARNVEYYTSQVERASV